MGKKHTRQFAKICKWSGMAEARTERRVAGYKFMSVSSASIEHQKGCSTFERRSGRKRVSLGGRSVVLLRADFSRVGLSREKRPPKKIALKSLASAQPSFPRARFSLNLGALLLLLLLLCILPLLSSQLLYWAGESACATHW